MDDLRSRFAKTAVLVAGDVMLDEYVFGSVNRISPEAPVPILEVKSRRFVPGGAANVAANVRALGGTPRLAGAHGDDAGGTALRRVLAETGIGDELLISPAGRVTTTKTRVVAGQQQIVRFDMEDRTALDFEAEAALAGKITAGLAPPVGACVLSDYGKGLLSASLCADVLKASLARGVTVIVDPKGTDYTKYRGCSLITPNLKEAGQSSGIAIESERDLFEAGKRLLALLPGTAVLVTRGPDGMTLFREGQAPLTIPTAAQEVFDVVGAGDTVVATLSVSLAAGLGLGAATRLANLAAGIAVGRHGTVAVSIDELLIHPTVEQLLDAAGGL